MQQSWRNDEDKLTFISCLPQSSLDAACEAGVSDSASRMLGDVNLFLTTDDDDNIIGELELMIAVSASQGKGHGRSSLLAFLSYIGRHGDEIANEYRPGCNSRIEYLHVRIGEDNERSLKLFQSLGFTKVSETANYFGENELRMEGSWPAKVKALCLEKIQQYIELRYDRGALIGDDGYAGMR
jgi:RimJ/RimL family protein N-acetyltransferase